jgi:hypothetical protein
MHLELTSESPNSSDPARHPFSNLTKGRDEWLTPPSLLLKLGTFDLDPCAPIERPWPTAKRHFTKLDNGLRKKWTGRVWLNPPYGSETGKWLGRLAEHGDGIAFVFARTETTMFFKHVWGVASAILFLQGRINFHHVSGRRSTRNCGAPSCLIAYGEKNAIKLQASGICGAFLSLNLKSEI